MKKTIARYKLRDAGSFTLMTRPPSEVKSDDDSIPVKFTPFLPPYYLDILAVEGGWCKMKIYMGDGSVIIGWQHSMFIEIHYIGDKFDGRFNSDANEG